MVMSGNVSDFVGQTWQAILVTPALEWVAVLLAIAYLVLAVRENIWCWACAFASTAIFTWLFHQGALISESLLNVFYLLMAIYGWYQWRQGGQGKTELKISTWSAARHLKVIALTALSVPVLGYVTGNYLGAALPYVDAFTTCFAVVATYMVTRKVLENWLYWFVIDSVSIWLYLQRGFNLTAVLFVLYLVLIIFGWRRWNRELQSAVLQAS
jgi:nicotinamide mononucleotide transporter